MLELSAFSDESYTGHAVYCVAGYWAVAKAWERFDEEWNAELSRLGLTEFHSEECANGGGEFDGRKDREELPLLFAGLVNKHLLHGMFAVMDLTVWDQFAEEIAYLRPRAKDRFYIPFQMYLESICDQVKCFSLDERVNLVFDQRPESGMVILLYNWLRDTPDPAFKVTASRLGDATSGVSKDHPGLQAADLLAYEAREHVIRSDWATKHIQIGAAWRELEKRLPPGRGLEDDVIPGLVANMRAALGPEARLRSEALAAKRIARAERGAAARARTLPSAPRSPEPEPPGEPS
ncbi:MAG TPA: DUF3800 domain-containing protein [Candidatus Dormibacteraeota bacterium]|nr:DUF3800 domain-containing protein [Candidatus Dormibacteraeota bacterium]